MLYASTFRGALRSTIESALRALASGPNSKFDTRRTVTLRGQDVITVDLNDAPIGLTIDQYRDDNRELPAATGVIPVKQFLDALLQIGYDGPIQAEPFNAALRAMPVDQACAAAAVAMKKALGLM